MASGKYVIPTKEETLQAGSTEVNNLVLFNRRGKRRVTQSIFLRVTLRKTLRNSAVLKREKNTGILLNQLQNRKLLCFTPPGLLMFRGGVLLLTCRSSGAGCAHGVQGGQGNIWSGFV